MAVPAHIKVTVLDLFRATATPDREYISKYKSGEHDREIIFKKCRVSGLVISVSEKRFDIDDGSGIIAVDIPDDFDMELPSVGDYIEVLGELTGSINRSITLFCSNIKTDPMEEVRKLLEQAAIHQNYLKYKATTMEAFLSSETNTAGTESFEKLNEIVTDLLMDAEADGLSFADIQRICGGDDEVTKRVVQELQTTGVIYTTGDRFYPL